MWNFILKWGNLLLCLFLLSVCQPMHYSYLDPTSEGNWDSGGDHTLPSRAGEREFEETFVSDKLDLVFVLNTNPEAEAFYKADLFGKSFLDRFQEYDWRFAYTDMSVDVSKFTAEVRGEEQREENRKRIPCPVFRNLILTIGGAASAMPTMTAWGMQNLFRCVLKMNFKKGKADFTNGKFLPLEYERKKWNKGETIFLTKSVQNHQEIFHHTMKLESKKKYASYDSPVKKDSKAYPLLSMILSLAQYDEAQHTDSSGTASFFRKDSAIVYVLITLSDFRIKIEPEYFKESVKSFLGSGDRLKIIPVTLKPDSSLLCQMKFQVTPPSDDSSIMEDFASEFSSSSLIDICSRDLAGELFTEISKSLYPTGYLGD